MVLLPRPGDLLEHLPETGLTVAIFRRKISPADKRFQIRRKPDAHRPTAATSGRLDECHINAIDVWPFLAINFDVHEFTVHDGRRLVVFKRLVRHDVAPVTSGIPDREEDRLVFLTRLRECFLAPRIPVDRIVRVLEKVGRFFVCESVRGLHGSGLNFGHNVRGRHPSSYRQTRKAKGCSNRLSYVRWGNSSFGAASGDQGFTS